MFVNGFVDLLFKAGQEKGAVLCLPGNKVHFGIFKACSNGAGSPPPAANYALAALTYASFGSLLSRSGLGHLGKGWIVRGITGRVPYWANGLFYLYSSHKPEDFSGVF